MPSDWPDRAIAELNRQKGHRPGWSYSPTLNPAVEPTVLSALALLVHNGRFSDSIVRSADWLVWLQRADGAVGISEGVNEPNWPTPLALLLWCAVGGYEKSREMATRWLLRHTGRPQPNDSGSVIGHNTALVGWPWVADTHSWLEPTAMAVLALRRQQHGNSDRAAQGVRLILDRAIPGGGWNYGNKIVFGNTLRPQPAPTGLALLALSGEHLDERTREDSLAYLRWQLPKLRSPQSLCWALLGLAAYERQPAGIDAILMEACQTTMRRNAGAAQLAYLLLASRPNRALELLGIAAFQ